MAELDQHMRKLVVKIVYYGPALSGKTTNLMQLHDILDPSSSGELMTFDTKGDRTLFFDFLPLMVTAGDKLRIKVKLYTVPGQVAHDATRKAVLSRADGVVFVADSQKNQSVSNFESFDNLEKNIGRVGLDMERLPLVVQFNKRDLGDIISKAEIRERWRPTGLPTTLSAAIYGKGVKETFALILRQVYRNLDNTFALNANWQLEEKDLLGVIPSGRH